MKRLILTCLASATLLPAPAQLFSPESLGGAFWGSLIGGIAGGDCRHGFSGEGAAIGAGVGLLAGAIAGESQRYNYYDSPGYYYAPMPAPTVSFGYGYGHHGRSAAYVYYSPNYYTAPGYYYRPTRPNYAVNGTLLGAASGALIGAGTGDAGLGAGIGAAAGLLTGGIAEHAVRKHEQKAMAAPISVQAQVQPTVTVPTTQSARPQAQDLRGEITSRPGPTSTYYWITPPPQIPDAPRVPDAPRF